MYHTALRSRPLGTGEKGGLVPTTMPANKNTSGGATTGYEAELWAMADALRGSMDAAEYKHVVLGLIFLKYISDAFEERHEAVVAKWGGEAAEDRDEYIAGKHLLGPTGSPLGAPAGASETANESVRRSIKPWPR